MVKLPPPVWAFVYLIAAGALSWMYPWRRLIDLRIVWLGVALIAIGFGFAFWAINLLRRTADFPKITVKRTSKWGSLGERMAKLKDGESILIEAEGDVAEEIRKVRSGLNCIRACRTIRHSVKTVDGKIVITRLENWPNLSAFRSN